MTQQPLALLSLLDDLFIVQPDGAQPEKERRTKKKKKPIDGFGEGGEGF